MSIKRSDFLRDVKKEANGCWLWLGPTDGKGYGRLRGNGCFIGAHRASLAFVRKKPKDKPFCLHSCDNPSCVNPSHLRWGTQKENVQDAIRRRRFRSLKISSGPNHPGAKLSADKIKEIWDLLVSSDVAHEDIGKVYGVSREYVQRICYRKFWSKFTSTLPGEPIKKRKPSKAAASKTQAERCHNNTINERQAKQILASLGTGKRVSEVARILNVSVAIVSQIAANQTWKHIARPDTFPYRNAVALRRYQLWKQASEKLLISRSEYDLFCMTVGISAADSIKRMRLFLSYDKKGKKGWRRLAHPTSFVSVKIPDGVK